MKNQAILANELSGVYPAIITPMGVKGEIDFVKLDKLVEDFVKVGVQGICACGTTGQNPTLSVEEHIQICERVFQKLNGRAKFIASAGSNNTQSAIELSNAIEEKIGPTTLLHVTGYYNNPPQEGLFKHFTAVATGLKHKESNVILYNVPARTNSYIEPDTCIALAKNPRIIGIKEAPVGSDLSNLQKVIEHTDPNTFRVLSGEDHLVVKMIELGGFGTISASANAAPGYFVKMTDLALKTRGGDMQQAYQLQEAIMPLVKAVFCTKNPIPLAQMFHTNVRLPLCTLERIEPQLKELMKQYSINDLGIDFNQYR